MDFYATWVGNSRPRFSTLMAGAAVMLVVGMSPHHSQASVDPLIEGARLCTQYFPTEEKKNSIPTHLLAAIATTESGRWHEGLGMSVPWPWTINVEGKGYYFKSKAEAVAQTQGLLARGYQSIDVGCMQVNLKHHPKAFANLNQAFDPATNVSYAAGFLRTNYASLGNWIKATAAYHSRTPSYGQKYLTQIERNWNSIVGKVAQARASKAAAADTTTTQVASQAQLPRVVGGKPALAKPSRPMAQAQRSHVIRVSDVTERRSSDMVVVQAPEAQAPIAVAQAFRPVIATPAETLPVGNSVRRVSLAAPPASSPGAGPKFVFSN